MARNYAALPHEYLEEMDILSDAEFGRLCRALLKYSMTGEEVQLEGAEKVLLKRVLLQEQRFQASYDQKVEAKREAGKKGAKKRWGTQTGECTDMARDRKAKQTMAKDSTGMASDSKNGQTKTKTDTNSFPPNGGKGAHARKPRLAPPTCEELGFGPELSAAFQDWLRYKQEKHQEYKPTGLKSLTSQVKKHAEKYGESAVAELIRTCMSANWQGIIWEKLEDSQRLACHSPRPSKGALRKEDIQPSMDRIDKSARELDEFLASLRAEEGGDDL